VSQQRPSAPSHVLPAPRAVLAAARHREAEICKTYPGLDEDIYITADAEAFVKWHAGQLS